ncbi:MAG: oligosaccharide flippase family protein [Azospirillaceae bacterium]|nr:oligosaccharide flippase family protein [Azospirillaceae bacterium]
MLKLLSWRRLRSVGILAIAHFSEALLPFVRSVALAHLVAPTQFGIAMAITTTAYVIELFTDLGLDRMAVRAAAAEDTLHYRDTLHAMNFLRGLLNGAVLMVLGPFLAALLGARESGLWFSSLGLICLLRGLTHFEIKQLMQRYIFWPEGTVILCLQISWTVTTIVLAWILHDARSMAFGIIAGQVCYAAVSHILARSRWRLRWNRAVVREALAYGVPLIPSSILTAANGMLDRFLVGGVLGASTLGFYTAIVMMSGMPRSILSRIMNNVAIPVFINQSENKNQGRQAFDIWSVASIAASFVAAVAILIAARPTLYLFYGPAFVPSPIVTVLIAVDFIPKFLICLVGTPALALGHTGALLRYTAVTLLGLVLATIGILVEPSLEGFLTGMVVGDIIALVWIVRGAIQHYPYRGVPMWSLLAGAFATFGGLAVVTVTWSGASAIDPTTVFSHVAAAGVAVALFAGLLIAVTGSRQFLGVGVLRRLRQRG